MKDLKEKDWDPETYPASWQDAVFLIMSPWIQEIIKYIGLPKMAKVCEFGCGCGKFSAAFAIMGCKVTCADINPKMLEKVKENFPFIKMEFVQADIKNPEPKKFEWGTFDLVLNEGVIEHGKTRKLRVKALKTMTKLCKKGGYVAVYVPGNYGEEYYYTEKTLQKEMELAGLKILKITKIERIEEKGRKKRLTLLGIGRKENESVNFRTGWS